MQKKLHIKQGDQVLIIAGVSKGAKAEVLSIDRKKMRATVQPLEGETVNMIKKHVKPQTDPNNPDGGIIEKNPSIHISNLMVIDPSNGEATKIGRKRVEKEISGKTKLVSVRYAKKSGEELK